MTKYFDSYFFIFAFFSLLFALIGNEFFIFISLIILFSFLMKKIGSDLLNDWFSIVFFSFILYFFIPTTFLLLAIFFGYFFVLYKYLKG